MSMTELSNGSRTSIFLSRSTHLPAISIFMTASGRCAMQVGEHREAGLGSFRAPGPTIVTSPSASVSIVTAFVAPMTAGERVREVQRRGATRRPSTPPPSRHTRPISL